MGSILTATVSVYLVMFLGLALATRGFVGESFWPAAQKLNYFVFLPVLFAHTLATAELGGLRVVGLILGVVVTLAIGGLAVGLWQNRTDGRHDLTPAVIEGALRAVREAAASEASAVSVSRAAINFPSGPAAGAGQHSAKRRRTKLPGGRPGD